MTVLVKTPCASATLNFFGVTGTTWNDRTGKNVWDNTLRRNGFAVRSRLSALGSATTVGAARPKIRKIAAKDKDIIAFVARVDGHVLVIDRDGNTVVDTDPRKKDKRKMFGFVAVWAK
jgi:hypothetical protein